MGSRVAVTGQMADRNAYSAAGTWFVSFPVSPSCVPLATPLLSEQCKHTAPEECWTLWSHRQTLFCSSFGSAWPRCAPRERAHSHGLPDFLLLSLLQRLPLCTRATALPLCMQLCTFSHLCPPRMLSSLVILPTGAVGLNEFQLPSPPLRRMHVACTARPCGAIGHRTDSKF